MEMKVWVGGFANRCTVGWVQRRCFFCRRLFSVPLPVLLTTRSLQYPHVHADLVG